MASETTLQRQYVRHTVDARAELTIAEESLAQVTPAAGRTVTGRVTNLSGGGAQVIIPIYLPRGTLVQMQTAETPVSPLGRARSRVMSVHMHDREPSYRIGLRFEDDESPLVQHLQSPAANQPPAPGAAPAAPGSRGPRRSPAVPQSGSGLTGWMALLESDGLVATDVLQSALRESSGDLHRAGEWLVAQGLTAPRDLVLAQAEALALPYIESAEYRVNHDNRAIIPEETARMHNAFPLFVQERIITLAAGAPLDLAVLDQIRLQTGREVDTCLARPRELANLIEWAYGGFQGSGPGGTDPAAGRADTLAWADILKDVSDAPAVKLVNVLLDQAAASRASDVHIDSEEQTLRVRFRVDGVLREVPAPPKSLLAAIVARIKILAQMDIGETRRPQDGHLKLVLAGEELDVRVSTLPSAYGEAVVMRLLNSGKRLLTLEELGMDDADLQRFGRLIGLPHGMLLVTGPTGSGKTTTLYSAISRIDRVRHSIITLEDPVEVRLPQIRQVGVNAKAGLTFQIGLRAILRQDPDVIMVGEIRDRETAEIALQAALTGHLVLSTLHTNSAAGAVTRLIDMNVADFLVASALVGVLAQRLCRRLCRHCATPLQDVEKALGPLAADLAPALAEGAPLQPVGCKRCANTGYDGRVGLFELLTLNDEMRRVIVSGRDDQAVVALARQGGMRALVEDGLQKVRSGMTTVQELLRVAGGSESIASAVRSAAPAKSASAASLAPMPPRAQPDEFDISTYEKLLARWLRSNRKPEALTV